MTKVQMVKEARSYHHGYLTHLRCGNIQNAKQSAAARDSMIRSARNMSS